MSKSFIRSLVCAMAISTPMITTTLAHSAEISAKPFTTVPWNGHVGAVSFTFDDGLESQIQNLKPILEEMPDVQVTFFIPGMSTYFMNGAGPKGFASLANAGHVIGNHSLSHAYLTNSSDESYLKEEIIDFADTIESKLKAAGAEVNVTAFATPYCANNSDVTNAAGKRHFINRDCGDWNYRYNWDSIPDWFKFAALTWTRSAKKVEDITASLDSSANIGDFSSMLSWQNPPKAEGQWMPVLNHGVDDNTSDDYSIDPDSIKTIIQHARDNKMWIAGFSTVAAYYMAHFTMDSLTATADGDSYKVSWALPSEHMPKSITLKVKLNSDFVSEAFGEGSDVAIQQGETAILPDNDGNYSIDFTKLELTLRKATAADSTNTTHIRSTIPFATNVNTKYTLFDMNGNNLGTVKGFDVPESYPRGTYIIRAEAPGYAPMTRKAIR